MDLSKSMDYFNPNDDKSRVHILGCGSVGSTVAENLARCGVANMTLWDFDCVERHNIVNQMFRQQDIGKPKVEALRDILLEINPEIEEGLKLKPNGWRGETLSGYLFLAVDNIDLRREILEAHSASMNVKGVFDFRTGLEDAQHFAADWTKLDDRERILKTMQFTQDEAKAEEGGNQLSACGIVLGVCPTVRVISAYGVANYINFINGRPLKKFVIANIFGMATDAFE
jgi:hypothetical protein